MAKAYQYICDGCNAILHGPDRGAFISKTYIQFKGQIVEQAKDEETGKRFHTFITPSAQEELSFCNLDCLQSYIDTRKKLWEGKREQFLREQAGNEEAERLENGGYNNRRDRSKPFISNGGKYGY